MKILLVLGISFFALSAFAQMPIHIMRYSNSSYPEVSKELNLEIDNYLSVNRLVQINKGDDSGEINSRCRLVLNEKVKTRTVVSTAKYKGLKLISHVEHFQGGDRGLATITLDHPLVHAISCSTEALTLVDRKPPTERKIIKWFGNEISIFETEAVVVNP